MVEISLSGSGEGPRGQPRGLLYGIHENTNNFVILALN
jgi:hypothetical protein